MKSKDKKKRNIDSIIFNGILIIGILWILSFSIRIQLQLKYIDITVGLFILLFTAALYFFGKRFFIEVFNIKKKVSLNTSIFYPLLFSTAIITVGGLLMHSVLIGRAKTITKLQNQKYVELKGLIKNRSENIRSRAKDTDIKIDKFPDFDFNFTALSLNKEVSKKFNDEVKKGDSIKVLVREKEFNKKILRFESLSFFDKHLSYEKIKVFDIYINGYHYLDLNKTIQKNIKRRYDIGFWVSLPASIVFIFLGLFILIKTPKPNHL